MEYLYNNIQYRLSRPNVPSMENVQKFQFLLTKNDFFLKWRIFTPIDHPVILNDSNFSLQVQQKNKKRVLGCHW